MHMFNRGFNGHPVNLAPGVRTGPVVLQTPQPPGTAMPAVQRQMAQVPGAAVPAVPRQMAQAVPVPKPAPAPQPPAPAIKPGAVPMGPKASCPVCRTFGG